MAVIVGMEFRLSIDRNKLDLHNGGKDTFFSSCTMPASLASKAPMKHWTALILAALLAACTGVPTVQRPDSLYSDHLFSAPSVPIGDGDIFALSDGMRNYLNSDVSAQLRGKDRQHALYDALYSSNQLKLEYDSTITRNAAQAFEARTGNCLSLVILTAALAKQLGLSVQYQSVFSIQTMSRSGDLIYYSSHVNLALGNHETEGKIVFQAKQPMTIDFLPPDELAGQRSRAIRESTIVAMYLNNRAAETLGEGKLDDAYWWARKAIERDPTFLSSYNTLGVIYLRHGNLKEAERILKYIVGLEPGNPNPIANLVVVLEKLGRAEESSRWSATLRKLQVNPPFYFFDLGMRAMQEHDYRQARDMFAKELERAAYYHEFHAALAAAYLGLGDVEQARKHLLVAIENSTTRADRDLYTAKLASITPKPQSLLLPETPRTH